MPKTAHRTTKIPSKLVNCSPKWWWVLLAIFEFPLIFGKFLDQGPYYWRYYNKRNGRVYLIDKTNYEVSYYKWSPTK